MSLLLCYRCCWYRSITFLTITIIFLRQVRKLTSTITIFVWHKPSKSTRISCLGNIVRTIIWWGWSRIPFAHLLRSQLRLIYQHFFRGHNAYATQSVMSTILYYDWFNRGASFADAYRHIVNNIITISLQVQSMIYHLVYSHMNDFLGIIIARTSISVRLTCTLWKLLRLLSQRHCTIELYLDLSCQSLLCPQATPLDFICAPVSILSARFCRRMPICVSVGAIFRMNKTFWDD